MHGSLPLLLAKPARPLGLGIMKLTEAFGFCLCGGWIRQRMSPHGVLSFSGSVGILSFPPERPTLPYLTRPIFRGSGRGWKQYDVIGNKRNSERLFFLQRVPANQRPSIIKDVFFYPLDPTHELTSRQKDVIETIGGRKRTTGTKPHGAVHG